MDISNLPPAIIAQATKAVEDYILDSRKEYAGRALPLEAAQRTVEALAILNIDFRQKRPTFPFLVYPLFGVDVPE